MISSPMSSTPIIETTQLGPFVVPRIFSGLWQVSSNAWGTAPVPKIMKALAKLAKSGFTAFADHYGPAEMLFGELRHDYDSPDHLIGATKWCVFKEFEVTRTTVETCVNERLERMDIDRIDILQLHWQNYADTYYISALGHLRDLQREGRITSIGLCNFDTQRTDEICTTFGRGFIISNQVQFSLVDTRPLHGMNEVCTRHGVKLLTYGTLCGGFLADKWLGKPEPDSYSADMTPSQRKYLDMINKAWGNWSLFQELLSILRMIGDRHDGRSIANIATRWVLDHPFVAAVLIGVRLGVSDNGDDNARTFGFTLTDIDRADIKNILRRSKGDSLVATVGDCGSEYR